MVVPALAMYQQNPKVYWVKIREQGPKAAGQGIRKRHGYVPQVIGVPGQAPPTAEQKLRSPLRFDRLHLLSPHGAPVWVPGAKVVLLVVAFSKDAVAEEMQRKYPSRNRERNVHPGVVVQVKCLQ